MLGSDKKLPKREPKEVKISNRKIVTQKELDEHKAAPKQPSPQSALPKKASMLLPILLIGIVAVVFLFSGGNLSGLLGNLGGDLGGMLGGSGEQSGSGGLTLEGDNGAGSENTPLTPAAKKPYTIMVYMNGTDLESKYGCATGDLQEMAASGFDPTKINLLILTGGTSKWKNSAISSTTSIYLMEGNNLKKLADLGTVSIADVSVLKDYIDLGVKNFPADKFGFVFWNHGGGTIHGYGSDQNFKGARMSISEIATAFSKAQKQKFEFIGFDCCLMGTLETAYLLEPYAKYMIASEETEPGNGWDYKWLGTLSANSGYTGKEVGKVIVDTFVDFYERNGRGEQATLSVVDLSKVEKLSEKFEAFMDPANDFVSAGGFNVISKARKGTKSFGYTGEDRSSFDLVDIRHLAENLKDRFGTEADALIKAVDDAVVYYRNSRNITSAYGISTYIPYAAKEAAPVSVQKYSEVGILPNFNDFLANFTQKLTGKRVERKNITTAKPKIDSSGDVAIKLDASTLDEINQITFVIWRQLEPNSDYFIKLGLDTDVEIADDGTIKTAFNGYWMTLDGKPACLYEIEKGDGYRKYSSPAVLNGVDVNIVIMIDERTLDVKILGAIPPSPSGDAMAPKYMEEIKKGDKLTLKYFAQLFLEDENDYSKYDEAEKWVPGEEITVGDKLTLEITPVDDKLYLYGFWVEDTQGNSYYTDFIEITY